MYISVQDIPEPLSRPDDSEYQEFRNYLAVTESTMREQHEEQVCHPNSTLVFENLFEDVFLTGVIFDLES